MSKPMSCVKKIMIWINVRNSWSSARLREAGTWPKINSVLGATILSQVTI